MIAVTLYGHPPVVARSHLGGRGGQGLGELSRSSAVLSTCGDARSTGAASSKGARCTSAKVVTMPRSAISQARTRCGSAPSVAARVVIEVGSSTGSTTRHPSTSASVVAGQPAQLGQPGANVLGTSSQMFAERDRKANACSDIGFTVLQPFHHRQRQVPLRRRQPRPKPFRQRGLDREYARRPAGRRSTCVTMSRLR